MKQSPSPPPAKRLVRYRQAASMYSVSIDYLRRIPADELPRIKASARLILLDVDDLEAFFRKRRVA